MELVVESAGVADWLPVGVPPPEGRRRRVAVGARQTDTPRRRLKRQSEY